MAAHSQDRHIRRVLGTLATGAALSRLSNRSLGNRLQPLLQDSRGRWLGGYGCSRTCEEHDRDSRRDGARHNALLSKARLILSSLDEIAGTDLRRRGGNR
jgi:hypothetical protein